MKKGKCTDDVANEAIEGMACLNKVASEAASKFYATAATDITGFGLAVHACEMAQSSNVSMEIDVSKLLTLPGALDLMNRGFVTRANKTNREFSKSMVGISSDADPSRVELVFDPQTSGGLLISVPEKHATELTGYINDHSSCRAQIVGQVKAQAEAALELI